MTWKETDVMETTLTKGTYRNIYWEIEDITINNERQPMKWTAGFRGTGESGNYKKCKENIVKTIDNSKVKLCGY